jgi:hypothetical protein
VIATVVVLGSLVFLVGFLVWRSGSRAKARTGSWAESGLPTVFAGAALVTAITAAGAMAGRGGVAAVVVAFWVTAFGWVLRRRRAQGPGEPEPQALASPSDQDQLPSAYRFRDEPERLKTIVQLGPMAILLGGAMVGSGPLAAILTLSLFTLSVVAGVVVIFVRRHRHQRSVIESVEERAGTLPPDELRALVKRLETEHGRFEMRRLRRLVS